MRILALGEWFLAYQWIRQIRKKQGLTQEQFAEKMGVVPRTVQRWEQGTRPQPRHYDQFQKVQLDLITAVITTAAACLAAGVQSGLTEAAKAAIFKGYEYGLKPILSSKFGADSRVMRLIARIEDEPHSLVQLRINNAPLIPLQQIG
jgi:transcriptional regulator with XRE-family HTH domain